jgi:hypothetical protein
MTVIDREAYRRPVDRRGRLEDRPFAYRTRGDGSVVVTYGGRAVTTLRGTAATRFLARVGGADDDAAQHLMARVTGNFKRGNERRAT